MVSVMAIAARSTHQTQHRDNMRVAGLGLRGRTLHEAGPARCGVRRLLRLGDGDLGREVRDVVDALRRADAR
jgi:hypothetical protein